MPLLPSEDAPGGGSPNEELISQARVALARPGANELTVITSLRAQGHGVDALRLALEQVELRDRAALAWRNSGRKRQSWYFTRDGYEAASHPLVAAFHAEVIANSGANGVIDLTAGLGSDSAAFIDAGLNTTAVERDPTTAALLAHNVPGASIVIGDCTLLDLNQWDPDQTALFIDPARRGTSRSLDGTRALPERDPGRWSPPISFVNELAKSFRVFMKAAPAFTPPDGWAQYVVSLDANVVEMFTTNSATGTYAVMINSEREECSMITRTTEPATHPHVEIRAEGFLYELDPAITRAGLSQQVAGEFGLTPVGEKNMWLFGAAAVFPHARSYLINDVFPVNEIKSRVKHLPGIALKTKDGRRDQKDLRKACGKPDHNEWALVILGSGATEQAVLVHRER